MKKETWPSLCHATGSSRNALVAPVYHSALFSLCMKKKKTLSKFLIPNLQALIQLIARLCIFCLIWQHVLNFINSLQLRLIHAHQISHSLKSTEEVTSRWHTCIPSIPKKNLYPRPASTVDIPHIGTGIHVEFWSILNTSKVLSLFLHEWIFINYVWNRKCFHMMDEVCCSTEYVQGFLVW